MNAEHSTATEATEGGALLLALRFDAGPLLADLERLVSESWTAHFNSSVYEGQWQGIALRGPAGASHPVLALTSNPGTVAWDDTPALAECPALAAAIARFRCPLQSVRLLSLAPGARIHEHTDPDLDPVAGPVRLHVPIVTNPDVQFVVGGRRYVMAPGETWFVDATRPHSVANDGAVPRIHMVLDCTMNDWLRDRLLEARNHATPRDD